MGAGRPCHLWEKFAREKKNDARGPRVRGFLVPPFFAGNWGARFLGVCGRLFEQRLLNDTERLADARIAVSHFLPDKGFGVGFFRNFV